MMTIVLKLLTGRGSHTFCSFQTGSSEFMILAHLGNVKDAMKAAWRDS